MILIDNVYLKLFGTCRRVLQRLHAYIDLQFVLPPADDHAAKRRHVSEVSAPCQSDVVLAHHAIVGRIETQPAERRAVDGHPGMRGVSADCRFAALPGGSNIAAYIAGGEAARAQAGNHEMREILTNAATVLEDLDNRSPIGCGAGNVFELAVDLVHEFIGCCRDRAARLETAACVVLE